MQNRVEHHMSQVGTTKQWLYPNRPLPFRHVIWIFCYSCMWSPNTNMLAATPHLVPGVPERWQLPIISSMLIVFLLLHLFWGPQNYWGDPNIISDIIDIPVTTFALKSISVSFWILAGRVRSFVGCSTTSTTVYIYNYIYIFTLVLLFKAFFSGCINHTPSSAGDPL